MRTMAGDRLLVVVFLALGIFPQIAGCGGSTNQRGVGAGDQPDGSQGAPPPRMEQSAPDASPDGAADTGPSDSTPERDGALEAAEQRDSLQDPEDAARACAPNPTPTTCAGAVPRYCDPAGRWRDRDEGPCRGAAPACAAGACVAPPAVTGIYAGFKNTCARFAGGQLKCWGDNSAGQLGLGDSLARGDRENTMGARLPAVDLGTGRTVQAVALGAAHACALLDGGDIKCWGSNAHGQLGIGFPYDNRGDEPAEMGDRLPTVWLGKGRRAIALAAGPLHTCAVVEGGDLFCWGRDLYGNLGLEGKHGDAPGAGTDPQPINLGTGRTAVAVAAGGAPGLDRSPFHTSAFTCALLDNGQVKCWGGENQYGTVGFKGPLQVGGRAGEMGDNLPAVPLGAPATAVAIGCAHVCATLRGGFVKCWGTPHMEQLGWGNSLSGPPTDPFPVVDLGTGRSATALAASAVTSDNDFAHTCALLDDSTLKCWGANRTGALGQGDTFPRGGGRGPGKSSMGDALHPIDLGSGRRAVAVAAGGWHTCALLDDGHVKCWGTNDSGELGLENTAARGGHPDDMGESLPPIALW